MKRQTTSSTSYYYDVRHNTYHPCEKIEIQDDQVKIKLIQLDNISVIRWIKLIVRQHIIEIAREWKILYSTLKSKFGFFKIWAPLMLIPKVWNRVIIVNEIAFFACCIFCRFRDNYKTLQFNSQTAFSIFYNCIFLSFFTNNLADLWDLKRHQIEYCLINCQLLSTNLVEIFQ